MEVLTFAHVCKDKIALMMCVRVMLNKIKKVSKFMDLGRRLLKKKKIIVKLQITKIRFLSSCFCTSCLANGLMKSTI